MAGVYIESQWGSGLAGIGSKRRRSSAAVTLLIFFALQGLVDRVLHTGWCRGHAFKSRAQALEMSEGSSWTVEAASIARPMAVRRLRVPLAAERRKFFCERIPVFLPPARLFGFIFELLELMSKDILSQGVRN
jgi:hypothetical protein